jgi:DNA polymerase-3 subunit gamma/tau
MALIKLNFLQQAIELSLDESGKVVKKKQIDGPVAYRERKILSMDVASSATGKKTAAPVLNHHANASATGSALYVQPENKTPAATNEQFNANPVVGNLRSSDPISPSEPPASVTSRPVEQKIEGSTGNTLKRPARQNLLDAIKAKVGREYEVREVENPDPLTMEKLKPLWDEFADNLLAQGKHSAANTFNAAKLTIQSEELFQIEVQAVTQKKIIEHEKMMLLDFLQRKFKNRLLTFTLYVPPTAMEVKLPPSSRERFDAMVKKNPALLALKNQLKLNLDY